MADAVECEFIKSLFLYIFYMSSHVVVTPLLQLRLAMRMYALAKSNIYVLVSQLLL